MIVVLAAACRMVSLLNLLSGAEFLMDAFLKNGVFVKKLCIVGSLSSCKTGLLGG